ncbi:SAF domain-containing protein [Janibacter melonis]|uniref:SAF domain-containing protein n=1 Tax=Janibacter melonis TaxID=262209 RepID=UPI0020437DEE|nr:SAF domain-containing protein [Janibacter melonis]MCM3555907.1 SAF domain-containing protein [Janibacter melonis]
MSTSTVPRPPQSRHDSQDQSEQQPEAGRSRSQLAAPPQRRSRTLLALALVSVLGALTAYLGVQQLTQTEQALAIARDVPAGKVITEEDLKRVEVSPGLPVVTIPSQVVGEQARAELPAGTLINPGLVGGSNVAAGNVIVPVPAKVGQIPQGLAPGSKISLVPSRRDSGGELPTTPAIDATVVNVSAQDPASGVTVVDVAVSESAGQDVARLSSDNGLTIIVRVGIR